MTKLLLWLAAVLLCAQVAKASNVRVTGLTYDERGAVSCRLAWDAAWRLPADTPPANHDAVWLFFKYRDGAGVWRHARLAGSQTGRANGGALQWRTTADGAGAFVSLAAFGGGDVDDVLTFTLNAALPADAHSLQAHAVEMVWVSDGPFWLGDSLSIHTFCDVTGSPIRIAGGETSLWTRDQEGALQPAGKIAGLDGTRGFYCMKYEVSQEQYARFLNCLSYPQQAARTSQPPDARAGIFALSPTGMAANRNGVLIAEAGVAPDKPARYACNATPDDRPNSPNDGQSRACNFLNWDDLAAWLDWAGLRPLSELEFEKAARGENRPVPREFAWGTPEIVDANTLTEDGAETESVAEQATATAGLASHGYAGPQGPLRCGFGATDGRLATGAGYYGARELSGNLWEICTRATADYSGTAGDGGLSPTGMADEAGWPAAEGAVYRGGAWLSGITADTFRDLAVSDRFYQNLTPNLRRNTSGGRGGRYPD